MRIAFVTTGTLATFGTTYRVLGLASELAKRGADPHILLPGWLENRLRFPDATYQSVPIHFCNTGYWSEMQSKYRCLRHLKPDIVHCVDVVKRCFLPSLVFCQNYDAQLLVDMDELLSEVYSFPKSWYAFLSEKLARQISTRIVVASRFLEKEFGGTGRNILYLPNAVDLTHFDAHSAGEQEIRQAAGNRKIITYMGSLYPRYEAGFLFEAAVALLEKRRDLVFMILGSGPQLAGFRARTAELQLDEHILWRGFIVDEEVPKYLRASDALVLPISNTRANQARCPGKIYQYIAARAPIVSNKVGEVYEALGKRGAYFEHGNIADFCAVLLTVLNTDIAEKFRSTRVEVERHSWACRAASYERFLINAAPNGVAACKAQSS